MRESEKKNYWRGRLEIVWLQKKQEDLNIVELIETVNQEGVPIDYLSELWSDWTVYPVEEIELKEKSVKSEETSLTMSAKC